MKRIISLLLSLLLIFSLCGCGGTEKIRENLTNAGYEVSDMAESKISSLNDDVKYKYKGKGTIISGFHGTDKNGNTVFVIEFSDRDDMTISYREIKAQLQDGQIIDSLGKALIYGYEDGVKAALK